MAQAHWFFKLFNSIKEEHEVDFAELELVSLLGPVERVRNFADVIYSTPLRHFISHPARIQDALTYEPCYGRYQGFMLTSTLTPDLAKLVRRLAYTREIVGVLEKVEPQAFLTEHLPGRQEGKSVAYFEANSFTLLRVVTNQYYLEKSAYVSKLSRNEEEISRNVTTLLEYPTRQLYRIPASATMSVGKRLEDYFTIREESSLYLTHMLHPYKGKFHAKMVRALLNYVMPQDEGHVMDNFAGSGTLLVEATLMGLNSLGVEINPLSVLMSNVKCESFGIEPEELKSAIASLLREVSGALSEYQTVNSGGTLLVRPKFDAHRTESRTARVPKSMGDTFASKDIEKFIITHQILESLPLRSQIRQFLLLGLSGTISDLARRTSQDFVDVLATRLSWMYRRVFLFCKLRGYLGLAPGRSVTFVGDTRDMRTCLSLDGNKPVIANDSVDAIVNSPPYSTALDYIRNDLPQLTILDIAKSLEELERNMIGNPNLRYYSNDLNEEIVQNAPQFAGLPQEARSTILSLSEQGRKREALRVYRFFKDMHLTLAEMRRVLRPGGKAVIIIGNNHYKLDGEYAEVKNDEIIAAMAEDLGFSKDRNLPLMVPGSEGDEIGQMPGGIRRRLEKTMTGMIRYETVLVIEKPPR